MEFIKNYNNNAALVKDSAGKDWVVIGKGIGFGLKKGMPVDESKIERRFLAQDETDQVEPEVVKGIDPQSFEATDKVCEMLESKYGISFTGYQYFALADHIDFMIKRTLDGAELNPMSGRWETKTLFPKEFTAAKEALAIISDTVHLEFDCSEAVSLTYHFINAESDGSKLQDTMRMTRYLSGIVNIVQYQYGITLDIYSFNYERFITHLRALIIRHLTGKESHSELDPALLQLMVAKYPKEKDTVDRIAQYLKREADWTLSADDQTYLILHIWRVTHR